MGVGRWPALVLVLVLAAAWAAALAPQAHAYSGSCRVKFIIYGDPRCPHCRATNRTLNMLFPGCVVFHDISSNTTANRVYTGIWNAVFHNTLYAVPLVVVEVSGKPRAFVVGEKPAEFWQELAQKLASKPPRTALVCLEPSISHCVTMSRRDYENTLNVIARGGVKITLVACRGIPDTVVEALYGSPCRGRLPDEVLIEAIHEFNGTVTSAKGYRYLFVYGLTPVLAIISPAVPGLIVTGNKTLNVYNVVAGVAAKIALQGLKEPVIMYVFMKNGTAMVGVKTVSGNETLTGGSRGNVTLAKTLWRLAEEARRRPLTTLIPFLLGLAALDSINPCFLALYTMLVVAAAAAGGTAAAISTGLAVALGVYTGYYLLGLGVAQALEIVGWPLRLALAVVMLVLGIRSIYESLKRRSGVEEEECRICRLVGLEGLRGPLALYGFGLLASWTLLPCTAGPYVAALILLEGYSLPAKLALLALYNAVFIAPLLAVMTASTKILEKYRRVVPYAEAVAGVILIVFAALIILEHIGVIPTVI